MVGCRRALYAYDAFLRKLRPKLAAHLERENVQPAMYATHWFVTVFAAQFPAPFAARAWDLFPPRGWKPVYQIGVALLAARGCGLLGAGLRWASTRARSGGSRRRWRVERTLGLALRLRLATRDVADVERRRATTSSPNLPFAVYVDSRKGHGRGGRDLRRAAGPPSHLRLWAALSLCLN